MTREHSRVLLASAGTGKTFQLTGRLLQLYALGAPPQRVLASTFTRKAAGEILVRVVQRLAGAARSEEQAQVLAKEIGVPLERARASQLLCALLRGIDRLRISTLDAWFQQRAQRAGLELGLPPDWEISDDALERRAAATALSRSLERERAPEAWTALIADQSFGGAEARVHARLVATMKTAGAFARDSDAQAWEFPELAPPVPADELARARETVGCAEAPLTNKGTPHTKYGEGLRKLCTVVDERDWAAFVESTLVCNVLGGCPEYYGKPVSPELASAVLVFARQAAHELTPALRAQNRATRLLAVDFVAELDATRRAERRLPFEALPRLLAEAAREGRLARERADVDHLLLDEFQDTSSLQWRALEPSVLHSVEAQGASFFCVGDRKQSIYGWRGAEARLLQELPERLAIPAEELSENRRSSPAVLVAVDRTFSSLDANPGLTTEAARRAGASFRRDFRAHVAACPEIPGCVRLWSTPLAQKGATARDREDLRVRRGVELALELQSEEPGTRVAFLLRRTAMIPRLLEGLKRAGIAASGEGGNPLTDSGAVQAGLSALEFADHPLDDTLAFHLATSPFAGTLGLGFPASRAVRQRVARELRERFVRRGPGALLAALEPVVRASYGAFDQRRFAQLVGLALRLEASASLRPAAFAARLAQERVPDPTSASVQVMTVHAAKGLEFHSVILLDLDAALTKGWQPLVGRRRGGDPAADHEVVTHVLAAGQSVLIPELEEVRVEALSARLQEELCILYVAMTRAVSRLELIVDPNPDGNPHCSFAALLLHALKDGKAEGGALVEEIVHDPGDSVVLGARRTATPELARAQPRIALAAARAAWQHVAPSRLTAVSRAPQRTATADLFRSFAPARERGRLWHAWLERLSWSEEGWPSAERLHDWAAELGAPAEVARLEGRAFLEALARAEIRGELSRAGAAERLGVAPEELELLREQRFAFAQVGPAARQLFAGALDRAVLAPKARRAEILDFKTDALDEALDTAALAQRALVHLPQMLAYRAALARRTGIPQGRIDLRVCYVAAGRSVALVVPVAEEGA